MKVPMFETAVSLLVKNNTVSLGKASSGGYLPENETDIDEMIGLIIEKKLSFSAYSFWLYDGDYAAFGIKTSVSKRGNTVPAGDITPAQFKKIMASGRNVMIGLVKKPWPQPRLIVYSGNSEKPAKAQENRIGK
jgi:hypothetical protein